MARPLTKHDQNGNRYTRPPNIETLINEALTQDLNTLRQRAELGYRLPGYLPSEILVHLIREAGRRGDHPMMNALLPFLLKRCKDILSSKITKDHFFNADDLSEEVLGEFSELFAVDIGDDNMELDFFECRFNRAFETFRIDFIRRETNRLRKLVSLPDLSDDDEPAAYDEVFSRVSEAFRSPATQEDTVFWKNLLKALPPEERKAVVLCHVMGYEVESEDPQKATAATRCGVTGRTIRNRLNRAAAKLLQFKE